MRDRLSLNENWIAISTGTSAQVMYSQVITTGRNRGRPQGFGIQPLVRCRSENPWSALEAERVTVGRHPPAGLGSRGEIVHM